MPLPTRTIALLVAITSSGLVFAQLEETSPVAEGTKATSSAAWKKTPPTQRELAQLTRSLNSDDFKTRESAQIVLSKLAVDHPEVTIDPLLENYVDSSTAPEARYRLRAILYNSRKSIMMENPPGFVGIVMRDLGNLVLVSDVVPDSAAARDGLVVGDRIASIDGKPFSTDADPTLEFSNFVMSKKSGDRIVLKVMRNNVEKEVPITLGTRPEELMDYRYQARFDAQFKLWLDQQIERLRAKL